MNLNFFARQGVFKKSLQLVSVVSLLGMGQVANSAITIDSFSTGQPFVIDATPANGGVHDSVGDGSDPTIIGGSRDVIANLLAGDLTVKMIVLESAGLLSMSVDATSLGSGTVHWDGPDDSINLNPIGLGGIDLTENGTVNAFELGTFNSDQAHTFVFTVYTDADNKTAVTFVRTGAVAAPILDIIEFDFFTDPALCSGGVVPDGLDILSIECGGVAGDQPADLTDVGAIKLTIDPDGEVDALDVIIDQLRTTSTCTGTIGDYVWNDANRDGDQDLEEMGIDGVDITVVGDLGSSRTVTTVTGGPLNQPGYYLVGDLCADTYTVTVDPATVPPGMDPTLIEEDGVDPADDSDDPAGTEVILPTDDSHDITIDFGYQTPCSGAIGDYVWNDMNRDGIQDDEEMGINGVEVLITDSDGFVHSVTTFTGGPDNKPGYYLVDGLCADTYDVEVNPTTVPDGFEPTLIEEPGVPATNDSNDPAGVEVVLTNDDSVDITIDFGYQTPCSGAIGNYIWNDMNRDGIQDDDEMGINGVEVLITGGDGFVHSVTTFTGGPDNKPGYYLVDGLCADTYDVEVNPTTVPEGFEPTLIEVPGDTAVDSNDPSGVEVTLTNDDSVDITIDFGYQTPCSGAIGDYIWEDLDRNGLQDLNEPGINGVEVRIDGPDGAVYTTTTFKGGPENKDGYYLIDGLCAGIYNVEVNGSTVPTGLEVTLIGAGGDPVIDSNDPSGVVVTLDADNDQDLTIDFGYITPLLLCDISIDQTCSVEAQPTSDDSLLCEAKIAATTLRYIGEGRTATVQFKTHKDDVVVEFENIDLVPGVTEFFVDARPDDLTAKLEIYIDGKLEEIIHTSCSAVYYAGRPAPLDGNSPNLPDGGDKGSPSPNWHVVNFIDKEGGGKSELATDAQVDAQACDVPAGGADVKYGYKVTNHSPFAINLKSLIDSVQGEILDNPPIPLAANASTDFYKTAFVDATTTSEVAVEATPVLGSTICMDLDEVVITVEDFDEECTDSEDSDSGSFSDDDLEPCDDMGDVSDSGDIESDSAESKPKKAKKSKK